MAVALVTTRLKASAATVAIGLGLALLPLAQRVAAQDAAPAGDPVKGKAVFESAVCGACHVLADADATGELGPSLDGNPNLTFEFVHGRIANGEGAMPPYAGQLSEADIDDVTAYVLKAAAK